MERERFDRLARLWGGARTRREALRLVAAASLLGGAATLEGASAKHHRKRSRVRRSSVRAQQGENDVPGICLISGGTGCSQEQGNCADKRFGRGANLENCNFVNQDLFDVDLRGANLEGTCWLASELFNRPSFRGANLTNACFFETDLSFSDFRATNVSGASFCDADLTGVDFRGSNVTQEQLECASQLTCSTILPNGKPAVPCDKGLKCCIDICVDLDTDSDNCGACGNVCESPATCEQGSCGLG
jgi:hypothetical protein